MPALVQSDKVIVTDVAESTFKQCLTIVEKKVRNLEKRKSKLDSYQLKKTEGNELNKDQQDAMSKYEVVLQNLDFARDLQKQFQIMLAESEKVLRKHAKREKLDKLQQESTRLQNVFKLKIVLSGLSRSHVKHDFLNGSHGALKLTEETVDQLCKFESLVRDQDDFSSLRHIEEASEHIVAFLDGTDASVAGTTYKMLQDTVQQIVDCGYFNKPSNSPCGPCHEVATGISNLSVDDTVPNAEPALCSSDSSPMSKGSSLSNAEVQHTDLPPTLDSITAKLTLSASDLELSDSAPITHNAYVENGLEAAEVSVASTAVRLADTTASLPFTFETSDCGVRDSSMQKKDAQEIVSAFDGNFNFLQDSLLDEDWTFSTSQPLPSNNTYHESVSAFSTNHSAFSAPVATYSSNNVFPTTIDTFSHNYVPDSVSSQPEFESSNASEQPLVTYANQFSTSLITTMPYMASPMISNTYFTPHDMNYGHQVAYTATYGSVLPSYATESVVNTTSCIYQVNENTTVSDESISAGYKSATEVYPAPFPIANSLVSDAEDAMAMNKMEISALNPNASEFHSRFTPPPLDLVSSNFDTLNGHEEDGHIEAVEPRDTNGDYQDVPRQQNGFRGRGRVYRGGPRGGRFNNSRGGYSQRYRNNYHRDGYNGDFNGSAWRGYNNRGGGRGRGMNGSRGGRDFVSNGVSSHDFPATHEDTNSK